MSMKPLDQNDLSLQKLKKLIKVLTSNGLVSTSDKSSTPRRFIIQSFYEYLNAPLNPLAFYERYSENTTVRTKTNKQELHSLADRVKSNLDEIEALALLSYKLLTQEKGELFSDSYDWSNLADILSLKYAIELERGQPDRITCKMFTQRLNYLIRYAVSQKSNIEPMFFFRLNLQGVWDFVPSPDFVAIISSGEGQNVYILSLNEEQLATIRLSKPTQISFDSHSGWHVGSFYETDYDISKQENGVHLAPLGNVKGLICFSSSFKRFSLSADGNITDLASSRVIKTLPYRLWKARLVNGYVVAFSYSLPKQLLVIDTSSLAYSIVWIPPVIIPNDVFFKDNLVYICDKTQGSLFIFSNDYVYLGKCLDFGLDYQSLSDPISITEVSGMICCTSWVDSSVKMFSPKSLSVGLIGSTDDKHAKVQ